jgi:hypothetical protein
MGKILDLQFSSYHFAAGHPYARELFKNSVRNVEIEVSSYCNRVCSFCPNSFIDRRSAKKFMDDRLYARIIADLASIEYDGRICFHRYNEPLADRAYILGRIAQCTAELPRARSKIYTNGDYLDRAYLDELHEAGLREMLVTIYLGEHQVYDADVMRRRLFGRLQDLGLPYSLIRDDPGYVAAQVDFRPDMKITVRGHDFDNPSVSNGVALTLDRAGSVSTGAAYSRRSPCMMVFTELQVELDGTVVPCCNIRTDNSEHKNYAVGVIGADCDIFQVWSGAALTEWRRRLFLFGQKDTPCASCNYAVQLESPDAAAAFQAAARQLGLTPA